MDHLAPYFVLYSTFVQKLKKKCVPVVGDKRSVFIAIGKYATGSDSYCVNRASYSMN